MTEIDERPAVATVIDLTKRLAAADSFAAVQPAVQPIVVTAPTALPDDPDGDRPWLPLWIRSREGWGATRRRRTRMARRALRRWTSRQTTARGHVAQVGRGGRRTAEWVAGVEGARVRVARHQAHRAAKDAKLAARQARYTFMPKQRDLAGKVADARQAESIAANGELKKARTEVRRGRMVRAAVAGTGPVVGTLVGAAEAGWIGFAGGLLATCCGLAVVGRKPLAAEHWDLERRSLGDGDALTESMLDRAFVAAKVMADGQQLRMVSPVAADGEFAWMALIDLPEGITVNKVRAQQEQLAGALGIDRSQLDLRQAGGAGRLALWASGIDPFAKSRRNPLIGTKKPINAWKDGLPLAFDKRGKLIYVTISDYSILFGGATRSGKGMGLANLLVGAMLDPRIRIRLFDGKGSGEYVPHARLLATYVRRNPKRLVEFLRVMVGEMNRRTEILVDLGLSKASEALIEKLGGIELVIVDELATYTAKEGPSKEYAEEIAELLAQIGAVGAATGIVLALATQFPEVGIVPSRLRGNLSGRMAMRTETPTASNVILGDGMVGQGYDASKIPNMTTSRGRGCLTTPDTGVIDVRSLFIDEATGEIREAIDAATVIRQEAGTLPGMYVDPVETEMVRITGASATAGGVDGKGSIVRGTFLDLLVTAAKTGGAGALTTVEAAGELAASDDRYTRTEGETDGAYATRTGRMLRQQIADAGVDLELSKVTSKDGVRTNGYSLLALEVAADAARNAR